MQRTTTPQMRARAAAVTVIGQANERAAHTMRLRAFAERVARYRAAGALDFLDEGTDPESGWLAARNIRGYLAHQYPKVRFFVRRDGYGRVLIRWTDGPLCGTVQRLVDPFKTDDLFRGVFGGAADIECRRELSDSHMAKAIWVVWSRHETALPRGFVRPTPQTLRDISYTRVRCGASVVNLQKQIIESALAMAA